MDTLDAKQRTRLNKLQKKLRRETGRAIADFNMISEGDGVTMAEMFMVMGPWMAKFEELKAADQ